MNVAAGAVALLSLLLVAQTIGLGVLWSRYTATREKARTTEQAVQSCEAANAGQSEARHSLRQSLDRCEAMLVTRREAGQLALQQRDEALAALDALKQQQSKEAEALYVNDPECGALRRVPVCPGLADGLRGAASNHPR